MTADALVAFLNSDAGLALKGMLAVAFLDFATGSFAALRDGTFALDALAAFVRKHIFGRVAPIGLLLTVGYFGGAAGQLFLVGAIAAAAAYVAETAASVWGNVNPPKASDVVVAEVEGGVTGTLEPPINPVPTD
jgi:hypothetical protein